MSFEQTINNDIKQAMLAKKKDELEAIRAIKSAILLLKTSKSSTDEELSDQQILPVLQKLVKQRRETAELYLSQNRQDLAKIESFQANIIERYLPKQLSVDEIEDLVRKIIADTQASSIKDMGRVMGQATKQLAGKADNKQVSEIVKRLLQ